MRATEPNFGSRSGATSPARHFHKASAPKAGSYSNINGINGGGLQNQRQGDSKMNLIYDKVSKIKETVKYFSDSNEAMWTEHRAPITPQVTYTNTLHCYVERERAALKNMSGKNSLANSPSPGKICDDRELRNKFKDYSRTDGKPSNVSRYVGYEANLTNPRMSNIYDNYETRIDNFPQSTGPSYGFSKGLIHPKSPLRQIENYRSPLRQTSPKLTLLEKRKAFPFSENTDLIGKFGLN